MTRSRALWQVTIGAMLLGCTPLFAKLITLPAAPIVGLRSVVAAVVLLAVALSLRHSLRVANRADTGWLLLAGLLMAAHWVTYFQAIQTATVAVAVVCIYTHPVLTVLGEAAVTRSRPRMGHIAAGVVMLIGVALVVPWQGGESSAALVAGAVLALVSAVVYSARNLIYRHRLRQYPSGSMMFWQVLIVALAVLPISGTGGDLALDGRWWQLLVLGAAFTALPHTLLIDSMRSLTASETALVACTQPVWSVLFAWAVLGSVPGAWVAVGGVLIVGAAAYAARLASAA